MMPRRLFLNLFIMCASAAALRQVSQAGVGTTGGVVLLESPSARSSALADAFSLVQDDVGAGFYNPATLNTLKSRHAVLNYRKGFDDDAYSQAMIGTPSRLGAFGLTIGYFNAGKVDLTDGVKRRTVTAQSDLLLRLAYAHHLQGLNWGIGAKYLRSELAEEESARTYAFDAGLMMPITHRVRVGISVENCGPALKFGNVGDPLPTTIRPAAALTLTRSPKPVSLLLEAPYLVHEHRLNHSVGLEIPIGPLTLRGGYARQLGTQRVSLGTGFLIGTTSLDYAFGLIDNLDSQHQFTFSTHFGRLRL